MNNVNFSFSINANQSSGKTYRRMEKTTNKKNEHSNKTRMINAYNLQVPMIKEISYAQ